MKHNDAVRREHEATSEIVDVAAEIGNEAVAIICGEDILEHVPVLKVGLAASKIISSVRDHLLMRKLLLFLQSLASVPAAERRTMIKRLEEDTDYKEDVGEHLIELLDRVEGKRKPKMIGAVFAAFARGDIELRMLRRLNDVIERIPIIDIREVRLLCEATHASAEQRQKKFSALGENSLYSLEVVGLCTVSTGLSGGGAKINNIGKEFVRLNLDNL